MKMIKLKIKIIILINMFVFSVVSDNSNALQESTIYIGWAAANITPTKPVPLRGQFYKRISKYVRDPLTATVLALETKGKNGSNEQVIMISCDQSTINKRIQDRIKKLLMERVPDFDFNKLFLNATHTHTAPSPTKSKFYDTSEDEGVMTEEEFGEFMVERIAEAAVKAWNSRKPGGVSWGLGHAVVGHNRRVEYTDGTAVMYGNTNTEIFRGLEGPSDHGVDMVFCWNQNSKLTGIIINVACPSQVVESKYYISADFWSEVRKELRKRYSEDIFVLAQCGAAGDQSPRDLPRIKRGEPNMREEAGLVEIGRRIADAVDAVYPYAKKDIKTKVIFKHIIKNINLPIRRVSQKEYEEALSIYTIYNELKKQESMKEAFSGDFTNNFVRLMGTNKAIIDRYNTQRKNPYFGMELHVLRLGDIAFATNPFELFLEYGLRIISRSKAEQTFLIQLSGDESGYLPTARAIRGGGYSSYIYNGKVGPKGGQMLVDETVKLINAMRE